ncbi:MAG: YceI family protein [Flavobacteriales bacterium]|nr:YceI family protein [Flavobacteriales bacterium]
MRKIFLPIAVVTALIFTSCGGGEKSETAEETTTENTEEICFYSYDEAAGAQVRWTAFKTSDKIGVGGQFDQVNVTAGEKSTKITDVLESIKFNIPTSSTNTSNEDRDSKIVASFFGAMNETDIILGQVKSATGDNTSGTCTFYLTINNIEKETVLDYTVEGSTVKLTGEIDMVDFGAEGAVASLNEICGALHTGEDGVTKTWSVVELAIETTLKKDCH